MASLRDCIVLVEAAALAAKGSRPLVFTGAALAFTHYPLPASRPRVDVDLLMSADSASQAVSVFACLGYAPLPCTSGTLIRSQVSCARVDRYGLTHIFDVHWQISIPQVFANLLSLEELAESAVPLSRHSVRPFVQSSPSTRSRSPASTGWHTITVTSDSSGCMTCACSPGR